MRALDPAEVFLARLNDVAGRLADLADVEPPARLTDPDPDTGERWEWAQPWSHMVEFMPYWRGQIDLIRDAESEDPVPFGRVKTDPERLARIEQGRTVPLPELWEGVREEVGHLQTYLAELSEEDWDRHGRHPTLGVMDMPRIVDRFLVGHLEEHAEQLEAMAPRPTR
jgi:hypothetical protein